MSTDGGAAFPVMDDVDGWMPSSRMARSDLDMSIVRKITGMKLPKGFVDVRVDESGEIDEVVSHKTFVHVERMSDHHIWMSIGDRAFNAYVHKGKLMFQASDA